MPKNLVIVESPAKAKTINKYLGSDYVVLSSYGHVRDLPKKDAIDIKNGFRPNYVITPDKKKVIQELQAQVAKSEIVWLATDDDREGEAISWHLKESLNLDDARTHRIVFREITKSAIQKAIQQPRKIDQDLVNAQQARRILDRLVGFELSPVLWKKIKTGLSAGRVQSAAVRIIVEREREIVAFEAKPFFKVNALFDLEKSKRLFADLPQKLKDEAEAQALLQRCLGAQFSIKALETKPGKKSPSPPFTTSTLQQEASRKLSFSVAKTMSVAQKLYEAGHITYMRTDSTNLSEEAMQKAAQEIVSAYGKNYHKARVYKTKSDSAQEAHEAIRPTEFSRRQAGGNSDEKRLYELIWKRAIASQMSDAQLEKTTATIAISTTPEELLAKGEVIVFDGFLRVYLASEDDEEEEDKESSTMLPPLAVGQVLDLNHILARERFTRPRPRYTEASLVKILEELGIGRPSTYAPIISTIQKRNYVVKESRDGTERPYKELILSQGNIQVATKNEIIGAEKMKLFPTDVAMVVNDFLVEHFPDIVDLNFTAKVEKEFDIIASGKLSWSKMLAEFYGDFHPRVTDTDELDRSEVKSGRDLGHDPKTGRLVVARLARYGPVVELVSENEDEKSQFASLRQGQFIETLTLEEALDLFKLPRTVGNLEGKDIVANIGRFGPYLRHDSKFTSIPKEHDPYTIEEGLAIELILAKREADAKKHIKSFPENPDIQILNGRWGPYIKAGKKNVKIPKDVEPESLTLEQCLELAEKAPEKKRPAKKQKK
ncbi:MAG: type I DNA topoisomerase [Bernardetiaceae bacterium]